MEALTPDQQLAIDLLYEAAKTFMPVVTGYLVLFSGALGYLWRDEREHLDTSFTKHAAVTLIIGILSFGAWSGTIPFCIRTVERSKFSVFKYGKYCASIGHILFFVSVVLGILFFWRLFRQHNE